MIELKVCFFQIYLHNKVWIRIRMVPELLHGIGPRTRKIQSWIRKISFRIHNTGCRTRHILTDPWSQGFGAGLFWGGFGSENFLPGAKYQIPRLRLRNPAWSFWFKVLQKICLLNFYDNCNMNYRYIFIFLKSRDSVSYVSKAFLQSKK